MQSLVGLHGGHHTQDHLELSSDHRVEIARSTALPLLDFLAGLLCAQACDATRAVLLAWQI